MTPDEDHLLWSGSRPREITGQVRPGNPPHSAQSVSTAIADSRADDQLNYLDHTRHRAKIILRSRRTAG